MQHHTALFNSVLTIPKLVPDNPKTGAWRSQEWCLTIVRHHFWDRFWDPKYDAWRLAVQMSCQASYLGYQKLSQKWFLTIVRHQFWDRQASVLGLAGTSFGTVRHQFWDCQAPVLGSSSTSFGISRLFLGYKNDLKRGNEGCFRVLKGVLELPYVNICYIDSHSNHVNHPFKLAD